MKIGAPKEIFEGEARVAMTPDSALQLQKLGHECFVESGAGVSGVPVLCSKASSAWNGLKS
ncbi:hypothetical protein EOM89_12055, partial [Candidatus Falkowbacteria bacterium]|nr:hypothetical protein [Candidatus Falkowbacteria bacterium]